MLLQVPGSPLRSEVRICSKLMPPKASLKRSSRISKRTVMTAPVSIGPVRLKKGPAVVVVAAVEGPV